MPRARIVSIWALGVAFLAAGAMHFISPRSYLPMMPSYLPWPEQLIAISGAAEMAGGLGVLLPFTRRMAGYGLIALLIAVFPANLNMAINHTQIPHLHVTPLMAWLRLPLQLPIIYWVWWTAVRREPSTHSAGG
jgi:uncharacterized membrane protein